MLCGLSVFQGPAKRATILVHQLPLDSQRNKTTGPVTTSISQNVQGQCANSHTNAGSALDWDTASSSVTNIKLRCHRHWPQLHAFKPVTPVWAHKLEQLLADHPNRQAISYAVQGFTEGFSLKYIGPRQNQQPKNVPSTFTHSTELWTRILKEVQLGRMIGPFPVNHWTRSSVPLWEWSQRNIHQQWDA